MLKNRRQKKLLGFPQKNQNGIKTRQVTSITFERSQTRGGWAEAAAWGSSRREWSKQ